MFKQNSRNYLIQLDRLYHFYIPMMLSFATCFYFHMIQVLFAFYINNYYWTFFVKNVISTKPNSLSKNIQFARWRLA